MSTDTAETKTYRPSSPLEGSLPRDGPEAALPSPTTGSAAYISNDSDQEQHMRGNLFIIHIIFIEQNTSTVPIFLNV